MRVSREQATENREKILSTATRLFREKGFDGIGIADLMRHAGLTHGGFYGHFSSKEDLMAQACDRAVDEILAQNQQRFGVGEGSYYQRFIGNY
jgi:TetR/AcrR family transcriptional regulator, transcriptional repressor for nem operon